MKAITRIKGFISTGNPTETQLEDLDAIEQLYRAANALCNEFSDTGYNCHPETGKEYTSFVALKNALRKVEKKSGKTFTVTLDLDSDLPEHEVADLVGRVLNDTDHLSEVCVHELDEA